MLIKEKIVYQLYRIVKLNLIYMLIAHCGIFAVEDDVFSGSSNQSGFHDRKVDVNGRYRASDQQAPVILIRTIPHPECLPLNPGGFECFRLLPIYPTEFLQCKYSKDIRMTMLNLLALVDHTPDDYFQAQFASLEVSIKSCIPASNKWKHVARHMFEDLGKLYQKSLLSPDELKAAVTTIVSTFVDDLKRAKDIDGLEMRLLCMREHTGYDVNEILEVVRALRRLNRDSIALHYLWSFAKQVPNLQESTHLCALAQRLDVHPFATGKLMQNLFAGYAIVMNKCITFDLYDKIHVIKAALRYLPSEGFDSTFVLSLIDYLIRTENKDTAIQYLLWIADKYSSSNPTLSGISLNLANKIYNIRAKKLKSTKVKDDAFRSVVAIVSQINN